MVCTTVPVIYCALKRRFCSTDLIPLIFICANGNELLDPEIVPVIRMIRLISMPIFSRDFGQRQPDQLRPYLPRTGSYQQTIIGHSRFCHILEDLRISTTYFPTCNPRTKSSMPLPILGLPANKRLPMDQQPNSFSMPSDKFKPTHVLLQN